MSGDLYERIGGTWYNQLSSRVDLEADAAGRLSGSFHSSVGMVRGEHPIAGYFNPTRDDGGTLGMVVSWRSASSVTVWSGRFEPDGEIISATWLLTGGPVGHDDWRSTVIGHDVFRRSAPGSASAPGSGAVDGSLAAAFPPARWR